MSPLRFLRPQAVVTSRLVLSFLLAASLVVSVPAAQERPASQDARTWIGRAAEIEDFIRKAEVLTVESIGTGVTAPKKAKLAPGGPVEFVAFKPLTPGLRKGFFESYKSEIAAYLMDRLLELDMVPPKVEREIRNEVGVAVMWVSPARSFKEMGKVPTPPLVEVARWNKQLARAKMFDNLIGNEDPNLGNWLVDPEWNLILIDHSRSFSRRANLIHEINGVDRALWDRMKALDTGTLTEAIGRWIGSGEIRAVLQRRDRMQQVIDRLVAERGESVWIK